MRLLRIQIALALLTTVLPLRADDLADFGRRLARTPPVSVKFLDIRFLHVLKQPLRSTGTLGFRVDGVLVRDVEKPTPEHSEVTHDDVRVQRAGSSRSIPLSRVPQLRALLASVRALLNGDFTPLESDFELALSHADAGWHLALTPREAALKKHLLSIDVYGTDDSPRCLEAREPDGDATFTLFGVDEASMPVTPSRADVEARCRASAAESPAR